MSIQYEIEKYFLWVPSLGIKCVENNNAMNKCVYQAFEHASVYAYWSQLLVTLVSPQPPKPLFLKRLDSISLSQNILIWKKDEN